MTEADDLPEYLTPLEQQAMALTAELANTLAKVVGNGSSRTADIRELFGAVHVIQHAVMANAAARRYPTLYRTLGQPLFP
jgi:hypothetical protein